MVVAGGGGGGGSRGAAVKRVVRSRRRAGMLLRQTGREREVASRPRGRLWNGEGAESPRQMVLNLRVCSAGRTWGLWVSWPVNPGCPF